jgi:Tfp pilus assembly protein PilV
MLFNCLKTNTTTNQAFTLIEALVGTALFLIIATASYQAYATLFTLSASNQYKILALELANEQFEIIRNMPYSNVGIVNGIPSGVIPYTQSITRGGIVFTVQTTIRNIDQKPDGTVASSTDSSPADNKLINLTIGCAACKNFSSTTLTTWVAPKNLETASTNGSLFIKAFDANGNPIQGANVHVVNSKVTPSIVVDDTTNNSGILQIIDAPPGSSAYNITVSKAGYSTDKTYPPGGSGNPNPTKPDNTVLVQQVSQASFAIDLLSTLSVSTVTSLCAPLPNIGFTMVGSKTIGAGIPKYSATTTTDSSGQNNLSNMEWDTYTFGLNNSSYDLAGLNILNPVTLNPNSSQRVLLVLAPKNPDSLLVTVKDNATGLPLTDSTVLLTNGSGFSASKMTGQGFMTQTDWSGGLGQANFTATNKYWNDDSHVDTSHPTGDVKILNSSGYAPSAWLESSTFDIGTTSNFHTILWLPATQPLAAGANSLGFQLASATTSVPTAWNYFGPDGTSGTYYTSSNSPIGTMHDGDRYLRYKAFLNTASATNTPDFSDVSFSFTTGCTPPGQVLFQGLAPGTYTLSVNKVGYTAYSSSISISSSWKEQIVTLGQ